MLRLMLTCHRNIVIPPEAGFAVWLYQTYRDWAAGSAQQIDEFARDLSRSRKFETWDIPESVVRQFLRDHSPATYPEAVSLVYQLYGLRSGRTFTRWGDKNNFYLDYIDVLDQMFPTAQFVHIVRDGRDVACSYRTLASKNIRSEYAPRLPAEIVQIAEEWSKNVSTIRRAFTKVGPERTYSLRLEDLAADPEKELRLLLSFLGEDFDANMLEFHRLGSDRNPEPPDFLEWKSRTREPLTVTRSGVYRAELDPGEIAAFEAIAGEHLRCYRYLP